MTLSSLRAVALVALLALGMEAAAPRAALAQPQSPILNTAVDPLLRSFRWRSIGPASMGGRVDEIAVVERDPRTYYVGYATGGLWKTLNGGITYEPLLADHTSHIGAVAVSQSNPDVVWVGAGEANNRQSSSFGDGVYRSTDGGRTWMHVGLRETQSINRIVVHPRDPDIVWVAATGHLYGPNPERGVYKTTDGGRTWNRVLSVDEDTGATDVVIHPSDPQILFAAMYQRRRTAWGFNGGGPGSGIWKSEDGGATWTRLSGNGLPSGALGRIALDMSRSNPNVLYAQIEALREEDRVAVAPTGIMPAATEAGGDNMGGVWRSADGGRTWEFRSDHNVRPMYFSILRVDPTDENVVYTGGRQFHGSVDGGRTFRIIPGYGHADIHSIWIDPSNRDHLLIGTDGGVDVTLDRGRSWESLRTVAVGQFTAVSVDMRRPYWVCGGLQDNSSYCGPSAVRGDFIANDDWFNIGGGDGGYTASDPTDPDIVYSEGQRGSMRRLDLGRGLSASIQPRPPSGSSAPSNVVPPPPQSEVFRWNWVTPFILSPHNPGIVYAGGNRLFKSLDRGDSWTMSADLTNQIDTDTMVIMGLRGSTLYCHGNVPIARGQTCIMSKNDGTWFYSTITTVAESPIVPGVLWVGTDDGNVQVSRDGSATWANVTTNLRGAPRNCYVSRVEPSHFDVASAYASLDCHRSDDLQPYVYVTRDFGRSWASITSDLPRFGCVNVVRQDPQNPRLLYVGTEFGFFLSLDEGKSWKPFMTGLPVVRIDDVLVHPRDRDLVLGTHGRSVFILDDVSPLQQLDDRVLASDVHLFEPRAAVLWRTDQRLDRSLTGAKHFRGPNPEPGSPIHYYLRQGSAGPVRITVSDASTGVVFRELEGPGEAGINRVQWNLRGNRTAAAGASPAQQQGPLARAGIYRVTLTVNGRDYSRLITVEEDVWLN